MKATIIGLSVSLICIALEENLLFPLTDSQTLHILFELLMIVPAQVRMACEYYN